MDNTQQGIVIKSTGSWYRVRTSKGDEKDCRIKGKLRLKGAKTTNPVAVGDHVEIEINDDSGVIKKILPRHNHIIRKSTNLSKVSHIIAANIDLALLVVTLKEPYTATGFIDRFLVSAEAYHISAALVFNKIDIYLDDEIKKLQVLKKIYQDAGYQIVEVSALTGHNIDALKEMMRDKVCLLSGISGVGKSALVNCIEPGLKLKTANISSYHKKGKHTTTFPEMHTLSFGGYIIDTPGIKEFGLVTFRKEEIAERFPEMRKYMHSCRFNNCTHIHEPGCAVLEALQKGNIHLTRYESYLKIMEDDYLKKEKWQWE
jgi:ribosome biogenesis GTPase / thiamine phosphate phosphatase